MEFSAVLSRRIPGYLPEDFSEVTLGGIAQICGNLTVCIAGVDQQVFGQLYFFLVNVGLQGNPFTLMEQLGQIVGADT